MTSKKQKTFDRTRLTFRDDSGKIAVMYEFGRKFSYQRREWKKCHPSLKCEVTHGFWMEDNSWVDSKRGRI